MTVMSFSGARRSADPVSVPCIICNLHIPLGNATAGSLYADGAQAFACTIHLRERPRWIIAWTVFEAEQQHTLHGCATDREARVR